MAKNGSVTTLMMRIFFKVQETVKKKFNIQELKRAFNASGTSVIRVEVYDHDFTTVLFSGNYKLGNDTIDKISDDIQYNGLIKIDYNAILNIIKGSVKRIYPDGNIVEQSYDIMDAYSDGSMIVISRTHSDNYLGDIKLFQHLYGKVLPEIKSSLGLT